MELGGECNINCSKTSYSANIVFHTKPFYGGKKPRITAEIFSPNNKKSFCSIEGEWNGVVYAKYTTGENTVFVDTKKLPIIKKKVRKLEDQNDYESLCLWKDITFNLKIRDIDAATEAKHRLEERQRAEAQERKEKEIQWETRLFHEDGECWVYDAPLLKRLGAVKHQAGKQKFTPDDQGKSSKLSNNLPLGEPITPFLLQWFLSQGYWTF
uniref:Uncharacterized protein n=1 Tax=Marmota marmota marmota TaxID=9994 RepID=A0A8C5YRI6_MARMA